VGEERWEGARILGRIGAGPGLGLGWGECLGGMSSLCRGFGDGFKIMLMGVYMFSMISVIVGISFIS
jgi:hypothetical protein